MHRTCPQDFYPAGATTTTTPVRATDGAGNIHFRTRFREREKVGPKAHARLRTEHLLREGGEDTLQLAKGDMRIHEQPFHLMEHRRVRDIVIDAVSLARHNDAHRRLLLLHRANLNR